MSIFTLTRINDCVRHKYQEFTNKGFVITFGGRTTDILRFYLQIDLDDEVNYIVSIMLIFNVI